MAESPPAAASPAAFPRVLGAVRRAVLSEYLVLWLSVAYVAALAPFTPGFVAPGNLANVLIALLPLFLLALGQTVVLIAGGIDLSVTSIVALCSIVGAKIMSGSEGWLGGSVLATPLAVAAMLLVGALVGAGNGVAVVRLRMPAFIVTLTGLMFFSGAAIWLTHSRNIGDLPPSFLALGNRVPLAAAIAFFAGGFVHLMLSRSLFGRWLFAAGHNARAAQISGVPVGGVTLAAYVVSGTCAALAAVLFTAQAETGSPVLGQRVLLDVIGATVLGGTSLFGGRGKVVWTLCGVLFLKLVDNSLNLLNLSLFAITMVKGGVILAAALLDVARRRFGGGRA